MQEFEKEDFLEDDDFGEFPAFDALVEFLKNAPPDERVYVSNPAKMTYLRFCAMTLEHLIKKAGGSSEMKIKSGQIDRMMGSLEFTTSELSVDDMLRFSRLFEFIDAFEVDALLNGKIRITLTFRNLYTPTDQT